MIGPNNWPKAKPAVIRERIIVALASARALASCMAIIVTTIKVPPTNMAAMQMLDAQLAKSAFVAGDTLSMGDIPVAVMTNSPAPRVTLVFI